jgi:alpha-tubulin suppressor-like RCC1 family protein
MVVLAGTAGLLAGCTALLGVDGDYTAERDGGVDATAEVGPAGDGSPLVDAHGDAGFPSNPGAVAQVVAGRFHTCARFASGVAMCWGRDEDYGELGNGTTLSTSVPEPAMGSGIVSLAAGAHETCAILADGAACAGKGGSGELFDGVGDADSPVPVATSALPSTPIAFAAGEAFSCAIVQSGDVYCAGNGQYGVLGNGSTGGSVTPVKVDLPPGKRATAISAFSNHACAVLSDGTVACWGDDSFGQLGAGPSLDAGPGTPVSAQGISGATAVCVGDAFSCAIVGNDSASTVWCWGDNSGGQLGNGDSHVGQSDVPVQVKCPSGAAALSCGSEHACMADQLSGGIWCWGKGGSGQLGYGGASNAFTPMQVSGIGGYPVSLAAGGFHTCAIIASPNVLCWGANDFGQLGDDSLDAAYVPVTVVGVP